MVRGDRALKEDFMKNEENNKIHDMAFKDFLGIGENCVEFLKAFLSQEILEQLYLITLIHIKGNFVNLYNQERRMDILVKIKMKDDKENQYMYVILEHKFFVDKSIISQISQYIACITKHQEDNNEELQSIYPIVFYHGEAKWNAPTGTPKRISDYANVSYQLIELNRVDVDQLDTTDDIKSMVYVFQKIKQFQDLEKLEELIQQLVQFSFFQYSKNKKM